MAFSLSNTEPRISRILANQIDYCDIEHGFRIKNAVGNYSIFHLLNFIDQNLLGGSANSQ